MNRRSKKSKFRSVFEEHTAEVLEGFDYEPYTVPYTIHRNYRPDFVHAPSDTLVECKGFFREGDTKKYTSIRDLSLIHISSPRDGLLSRMPSSA